MTTADSNIDIAPRPARPEDARYLASLDGIGHEESTRAAFVNERKEFWLDRLTSGTDEKVYVAILAGAFRAGYIALQNEISEPRLIFNPRFPTVGSKLLEYAGLKQTPAEPDTTREAILTNA